MKEKNNQCLEQKGIMMAQLQILNQRKSSSFHQNNLNILNTSAPESKIKINPFCTKHYYFKSSPYHIKYEHKWMYKSYQPKHCIFCHPEKNPNNILIIYVSTNT